MLCTCRTALTTLSLHHQVDCPDFMVEKTIMAPGAGSSCSDATVDITFEPSKLGEQHGTLTLTSPVGGEYVFPLTGMCLPPRPQGPFVVKSGTMTGIPFHNVFNTTVTYTLQVCFGGCMMSCVTMANSLVRNRVCTNHGNLEKLQNFDIQVKFQGLK